MAAPSRDMSRLSRVSEISEDSTSSSGRAPNFSRPHPQRYDSGEEIIIRHPRRPFSNVHAFSAFHQPSRDLPDEPHFGDDSEDTYGISAFHDSNRNLPEEPRFSEDSERTQTTASGHSAGSETAWDGQKGELVTARPKKKQINNQRYTSQPRSRPTTARTATSGSGMSAFVDPKASSSSRISKRVSIDVQSDRWSTMTNDQYEDTASHHTISDDEDAGSFDNNGEWRSSDYDTTGLSDAKIRKLLKKGINPHLYAEMQAAKKNSKSKWIGPLVGNSFIG